MIMVSVVDKASVQLLTLHYGPSPLSLSRSLASRGSGQVRGGGYEELTSSASWSSLVFRSGAAGLSGWSFGLVFLADLAGLLVI